MVLLASGYVMNTKVAMSMAKELGIEEAHNNVINARVFLNRHTRSINPNFPMIRAIGGYTPFKPDDTFAYILVTRHADDNRNRKFKERLVDRKIRRAFMNLGGLKDGDLHWDTVPRRW
ncbi:hypothetical protein HGRIS_001562 [Hohenbuehelia grisea]|uniref:Uncharacterized protein n=1 Tax=Hohenbuehelia grisea TaxID=104357 RepID=A0ABR3JPN9_9AGAR